MYNKKEQDICHLYNNCLKYIVAVKAIELEHVEEGILERISKKYSISEEHVDEYYAAILTILKIYLRSQCHNIKPVEFKQCLEELK